MAASGRFWNTADRFTVPYCRKTQNSSIQSPIKKLAYRKVAWQRRNFCCFPKHSHSKASRDSGSYQHCYLGLSLFSGFPSGRDAAGAGSSLATGSKQSEKVGRFPASLLVLDFLDLRSPRPSASCLSGTRCICRWSCCRARGPENNCKLSSTSRNGISRVYLRGNTQRSRKQQARAAPDGSLSRHKWSGLIMAHWPTLSISRRWYRSTWIDKIIWIESTLRSFSSIISRTPTTRLLFYCIFGVHYSRSSILIAKKIKTWKYFF